MALTRLSLLRGLIPTVLVAVMLSPAPIAAQNNTAPFATGTNCSELSEPRRSACRDAFNPRTNPSEWQKRKDKGAILPKDPPGLGRPPATIAPKAPYQPNYNPTPLLPRFKPLN
jgi:hypothetical protein